MSCRVTKWVPMDQVHEAYKAKLVTAAEAVKNIKSGDYIHLGLFSGVVVDLEAALADRADELEDVTICTTMWSYAEKPKTLQVGS